MTQEPSPTLSKTALLIRKYRAERLRQRERVQAGQGEGTAERDERSAVAEGSAKDMSEEERAGQDEGAAEPEGSSAVLANPAPFAGSAPRKVLAQGPGVPTAPPASDVATSAPGVATPIDPPLAEMGFGLGMLIRLGQVGLHSTRALAEADPAALQTALGEISRVVGVERWIAEARRRVSLPDR